MKPKMRHTIAIPVQYARHQELVEYLAARFPDSELEYEVGHSNRPEWRSSFTPDWMIPCDINTGEKVSISSDQGLGQALLDFHLYHNSQP